jgi:hypothetical protein
MLFLLLENFKTSTIFVPSNLFVPPPLPPTSGFYRNIENDSKAFLATICLAVNLSYKGPIIYDLK